MESCFFNLSPQREQFKTFPPFFRSFNPCYYLLLTGNSRNDANDVMMENMWEMFQWMQPHAISGEWHCTYVSVVWSLIDHTRDALEGSQCKYGYKTNIIFSRINVACGYVTIWKICLSPKPTMSQQDCLLFDQWSLVDLFGKIFKYKHITVTCTFWNSWRWKTMGLFLSTP